MLARYGLAGQPVAASRELGDEPRYTLLRGHTGTAMTERHHSSPRDAEDAARLLESLLDGSCSPSRPDVVRALRMAVEALRKQ
ncbi:MAG: hypothetical protein ACO3JL_21810, partial [Myxococcota bacterium]